MPDTRRRTTSTWERVYPLRTPLEAAGVGGALVARDPADLAAVLAEAAADMRGVPGTERWVVIDRFTVTATVRLSTLTGGEEET